MWRFMLWKDSSFGSKTDGGAGWAAVEKRFDELSASTNGVMTRAHFGLSKG
ncbi:hypothetical protein ACOSQ2_000225 [Xanthoceras sorbifolium]